ncbi:MAG: hypothetical protein WD751_04975 [Anaerolineales bacterium]
MWNNVFSSLEALFLQFNVRRLFYWITLILIVAVLLVVGERLTGFIYFWQVERKIDIVSSLLSLNSNGIRNDPQLASIYEDLINSVKNYVPASFSFEFAGAQGSSLETLVKFLGGSLLGVLVALSGYSDRNDPRKTQWRSTLFGGLFFGLVFGFVGIVIPTYTNPWVNLIAYPVIQIIFILILSKLISFKKR